MDFPPTYWYTLIDLIKKINKVYALIKFRLNLVPLNLVHVNIFIVLVNSQRLFCNAYVL